MKAGIRAISMTAAAAMALMLVPAQTAFGADRQYTTDADFDLGAANNVVHSTPDQLQLDDTTTAFPFIWVALSARGTIAKIDTVTGAVLGEYSTTSDGDDGHNPSRTTVANDGSVWAGNRNQSSVIHVGNLEAGGCVDRNGNGTIETSTGYGDVLPWPGGAFAASAPVTDAADECILHSVDTAPNGYDARHLSVDADGNVWVGAFVTDDFSSHDFQLLNGSTGAIMRSVVMPCGGYGGLIDGNGVLWSSTSGSLLRWDPASDPSTAQCLNLGIYGLAFDSTNHIWASTLGEGVVYKVAPDGLSSQSFPQGVPSAQGLAVDANDDVWISNSLFEFSNSIAHLKNDGSLVGVVTGAGGGSTGVSVDAAGKIWTANINSSDATRIDPTAGPLGPDGVTRVGAFDLTVPLPGADPYNYSDMTGSTLSGKPTTGTWSVVYDSAEEGAEWGTVDWTADVPGDGALTVRVSSSVDGGAFSPEETATDGADISVPDGRYLKVVVAFTRATTGESPILYDLAVATAAAENLPPTAAAGGPYSGPVDAAIALDGTVSDPEGAPLTTTWTVDDPSACAFADPSAVDTDLTCSTPGSYTVTLTASDGVNPPVSSTASVTVEEEVCEYTSSFKRPFDASTAGQLVTNTIKNGRVAPVKVALVDACTGLPVGGSATVTLQVSRVSGSGSVPDPVETYADAGQSSGGTDRFRMTDGFWIYNLDTRALGLTVGNTYRIDVFVNGVMATTDTWLLIKPVR